MEAANVAVSGGVRCCASAWRFASLVACMAFMRVAAACCSACAKEHLHGFVQSLSYDTRVEAASTRMKPPLYAESDFAEGCRRYICPHSRKAVVAVASFEVSAASAKPPPRSRHTGPRDGRGAADIRRAFTTHLRVSKTPYRHPPNTKPPPLCVPLCFAKAARQTTYAETRYGTVSEKRQLSAFAASREKGCIP